MTACAIADCVKLYQIMTGHYFVFYRSERGFDIGKNAVYARFGYASVSDLQRGISKGEEELRRAWGRCLDRLESRTSPEIERLMEMMSSANLAEKKEYKKRFTVKAGEKIVIIPTEDIAYCYSEDKSTYSVSKNGTRRLLDYSLDTIQEMLNPHLFFRISRSYIVSINAIENISKHLGTRLKLQLRPHTDDEVIVSRSRTSDFMEWLDNN